MSSKQSHRGKHPKDSGLFTEKWAPTLRRTVADLSFLLSRGYPGKSALKFVGDRHQLALRQRRAVSGAACSDESLKYRTEHRVEIEDLCGVTLSIDGYNLLIIAESALSGGVLLKGRDGCIRDLASIHGSYRRVAETSPAISLIGKQLEELKLGRVDWYLDAPVSNSGRLKTILLKEAETAGWNWNVQLRENLDKFLAESGTVIASSDSWILDRAGKWVNLAANLIGSLKPEPVPIDLGTGPTHPKRSCKESV